ncbi:MAG: NAD-dependent epimerase/dehydratase family protein [Desulfobacterales bacterium]
MRVLITGGAGFLGSNLVRRCLVEKSCQVTVLDSLDPLVHSTTENLQEVWSQIRFIRGDIRNETLLAEVVQDQDVIFNCAAQTSHALSVQYPLLDAEINCLGSLKLLEAVRLLNKDAVVVYSSSSTVIGKRLYETADEDHAERPLEIYSANKGVAEKYYRIYHTHYDLKTVVLRFANLFGPYGKSYPEFGFVNYFIHQAWTNQQINIFGKGQQSRNIMYVDDATEILWRAVHEPRLVGDTYLATGTQHLTVREIADAIVSVFQRGQVKCVEWPDERRRIEIGDVNLSSARLRTITNWEPRYNLNSGLQKTKDVLENEHH